mmetsp:Transcript_56614/g.84195  ORF Transcript_56614/g.84195 Transcript_56614/m.84195 type:complete len:103 (-) Transcript_56614:1269-1577(-)
MPFIYMVQILIYNSSSFELRRITMVLLFMMVATAVGNSDIVLVDCIQVVKQVGSCSFRNQFENLYLQKSSLFQQGERRLHDAKIALGRGFRTPPGPCCLQVL